MHTFQIVYSDYNEFGELSEFFCQAENDKVAKIKLNNALKGIPHEIIGITKITKPWLFGVRKSESKPLFYKGFSKVIISEFSRFSVDFIQKSIKIRTYE